MYELLNEAINNRVSQEVELSDEQIDILYDEDDENDEFFNNYEEEDENDKEYHIVIKRDGEKHYSEYMYSLEEVEGIPLASIFCGDKIISFIEDNDFENDTINDFIFEIDEEENEIVIDF